MFTEINGQPGIGTAFTATTNLFIVNDRGLEFIDGGRVLDMNTYDWTNPTSTSVVQCGNVLGRITATGKYSTTLLGILTANAAAGGTSVNIGSAAATALALRLGTTGTNTLAVVSPPASGGVVASQTISFTGVDTVGGNITGITGLTAAVVLGGAIVAQDGTQNPIAFLQDTAYGLNMLNLYGTRSDAQIARLVIAGHLHTITCPALSTLEASTLAYFKSKLNSNGRHFIFDDEY